ncbi:FAD-dependent oxidoreductase [bacterium]|nr:FAD-dependent oxidoreductase [candidate division CSSED10-310 bacterium]
MKNSIPHIAVLGAGISGLWTARTLLKRNPALRVTILESRPEPGGLFTSSDRCGHHFNHGLFLFPPDSPLIADQPHRFHSTAVRYDKYVDGRIAQFPVDPSELKAVTGFSQVLPLSGHLIRLFGRNLVGTPCSDLDEWLRRHLPGAWSERFRIPDYVYKLMGVDPAELSPDVGPQRLEFISRMFRPRQLARHLTFKLRLMLPVKPSGSPPVMHRVLNREGTTGFIRELAERIRTLGAGIETSNRIRGISGENGGFRIRIEDREPLDCSLVISTIPVTELARYRGNATTAGRLKWRNLTLHFFRLHGSIPEHTLRVIYSFDRDQCWKRAVLERMDDAHLAVLAEVTGENAAGEFPETQMERIRSDLTGILGAQPEDWLEWDFLEVPYGYPCLLKGYQEDYARLTDRILPHGLYSLSRQGAHRYATSSLCVRMVETDVERIMERHRLTGSC